MVFRLWLNTENEAFYGNKINTETARILREVADRLDAGESFTMYQTLFDVNGNDVGRAAFKEGQVVY